MATKICFTNPKHSSQVFSMFAEMRDMDEFCDIKVETSVDEISAHKVVLSACSPYFREALKDIDADEENFVLPEEHDSRVVATIINYFYTGRLEFDAKLLPQVLTSAYLFQPQITVAKSMAKYDILLAMPNHLSGNYLLKTQDILDRLEDHVVRHLTVENCLEYFSKVEEYELKDLQKTIIRYISWHFNDVAALDEWLELPASKIVAVVRNDVLNIEKEEDVYEALWKWLEHDEERKGQCEALFSNVRFFQLDPKFITERVVPDLAKGIGICKDEIKQAIIYQSSDKKKRQAMDTKLNHRYPSKIIYMFDNKASVVEKYDPIRVDCVQERRIMDGLEGSSDQGYKAAVVVNNDLYVISSTKVEKFNNLVLAWEKVGKGVNIRESAICADEENFYVIGGREQPTAAKCFNVTTQTWTSQIADMPEGRRSAAAVASNGRIYVMGGYGVEEPLATTLRYSNRSAKWKMLVKMNSPRFGLIALIIRNQIFAIGGRNNSGTFKSIETFDLESDKEEWVEFKHDMIRPRNECGAVFFNGQLWCMGGRGENSIESFDFSTNTWELIGKLGDVRYGMSCVLYSLF